jgi:hypothetical protein
VLATPWEWKKEVRTSKHVTASKNKRMKLDKTGESSLTVLYLLPSFNVSQYCLTFLSSLFCHLQEIHHFKGVDHQTLQGINLFLAVRNKD